MIYELAAAIMILGFLACVSTLIFCVFVGAVVLWLKVTGR